MAGDKLVRDFATLTVLRDLGTVPEDRLSDFGLDEPSARIRCGRLDGTGTLCSLPRNRLENSGYRRIDIGY